MQLSSGEQLMLAIGRALMTNPQLLLLDEASEGLAPKIRLHIWNSLQNLKKKRLSILLIDKNDGALTRKLKWILRTSFSTRVYVAIAVRS
jgi:branched-chain amino acid transport system ATP-binding protein